MDDKSSNQDKGSRLRCLLVGFICFISYLALIECSLATDNPNTKPNIILIVLDDMGYGDAGCYNAESKIRTPNIDRIAANGIRFTDAHAPASVCVPSRYGLLTGRYPRIGKPNPIPEGTETIASMLKSNGYRTAMVGKWHNGFDELNDYQGALRGGPVGCGFDSFFGIPHSLDIPPYAFIKDNRVVQSPSKDIARGKEATGDRYPTEGWNDIQGAFWRAGKVAPDFRHEEVLRKFTDEAVDRLNLFVDQSEDAPFFLYLAYAGPHTPWLPSEKFLGQSAAGLYGDFLEEIDSDIGRVLRSIQENGIEENTLVILTSDNGPVWYEKDFQRFAHRSAGSLRGMKFDSFEGGHRMPFVAAWPAQIPSGSTCSDLVCFTDIMATFADITGAAIPDLSKEDSISFLSQLKGEPNEAARMTLVNTGRGYHAIRSGKHKLLVRKKPNGNAEDLLLFDLSADIGEARNIAADSEEIVVQLRKDLEIEIEARSK